MALQNGDPASNPLGLAVTFDTIIDGDSFSEIYLVTGPTFNAPVGTSAGMTMVTTKDTDPSVKIIGLEKTRKLCYSVYLPKMGRENTVYLIPSQYNAAYEGDYQDLTTVSELKTINSTVSKTWKEAASNWVTTMVGGSPSVGEVLSKTIHFTAVGGDTNRPADTIGFKVELQYTLT